MSTALAIAATTRVLTSIIEEQISNANVGSLVENIAQTTASPPDHLTTGATEKTHLNLFLYHLTFNQGWREVGLASRNQNGDVIDRPPLALDLHYLLSAYGAADMSAEVLLGLGMQAFHETPLLYRAKIDRVFKTSVTSPSKKLTAADLTQVELIRITPQPLTTEDLSKLWTAFGSKYRPSVAYTVSVVLVESSAPVTVPLPVLQRSITVIPFEEPSIDNVAPSLMAFAPSLMLKLHGTNLGGAGIAVIFDAAPDAPQTPNVTGSGDTATVVVPPLPAGINTLRAVRFISTGAPPPRAAAESNSAAFTLQPVIRRASAPPNNEIISVGPIDTTVTPKTKPVSITVDPPLLDTQRVTLLLNARAAPPGHTLPAFAFDANPTDIVGNVAKFHVPSIPAGDYLVRIRVDGAASALRSDAGSAFTAPHVLL